MPSVGIRRSTRVFGTRVLRSGRRLWTEPHEGRKHVRTPLAENKFEKLLDSSAGGGDFDDHRSELWLSDGNRASVDITAEPRTEERKPDGADEKDVEGKCGVVYKRKRKRAVSTTTEDGRFAKKYVKKQWRIRCRAIESFRTRQLALVVNGSSYDCYHLITCFLNSLLSYMTRVRVGMKQLSSFMCSKPLSDAYSSCGMLFLRDHNTARKPCICVVSGSGAVMPLFSVNIFAIPPFFVHLQTCISLRSAYLDCLLVRHFENDEEEVNDSDDAEELPFQIPFSSQQQDCVSEVSQLSTRSDISCINGRVVGLPKSTLRNYQLRSSRSIQKRRSSLRRKRGRPPSAFRAQKARVAAFGGQFSASSSNRLLRSPDKRRLTTNIKEVKAYQDASSCSANLLITDTDKCYRVEGVSIALELSDSKQWFLTVSKDGMKQCSLIAEKVMRPSSSNRFTHAVVWSNDGGLKFEFRDKQDWLVFKELYKECFDRNVQSHPATVIPIPGVREVTNHVDQHLPFVRPESYITFKDDELIRALMRKTANYDMDSDDEEWLAKPNDEVFLTLEKFEMIVDTLEKHVHCNPDEELNEQEAVDLCVHLERKEVVEGVYKYWIGKRKRKRSSALVKVFQIYQPRKSYAIPTSVLRKKRSFKRQASQDGRGKQRPLFKATTTAEGRDGLEGRDNKLEEAKVAADKYECMACEKRVRAQMLMENADLATYKAIMALRIADAAAAQVQEEEEEESPNLGRPTIQSHPILLLELSSPSN